MTAAAERQARRRSGRPPTPEALRKRRQRQRLRDGSAVFMIPVGNVNALIAALVDLHWLSEREAEDRRAIAGAVGRMLDDLAGAMSR